MQKIVFRDEMTVHSILHKSGKVGCWWVVKTKPSKLLIVDRVHESSLVKVLQFAPAFVWKLERDSKQS